MRLVVDIEGPSMHLSRCAANREGYITREQMGHDTCRAGGGSRVVARSASAASQAAFDDASRTAAELSHRHNNCGKLVASGGTGHAFAKL